MALALTLALFCIAIVSVWKRAQIKRLFAVISLFKEEKIVWNFSNMNAIFLNHKLDHGDGPIASLPAGPDIAMPPSYKKWVKDRKITSVLVLKEGKIAHQAYYFGTNEGNHRISWSIAKSYLSALFGILVSEGAIGSLDDPVTKYVPSLAGGAYDGATLLNVLQMSSGIAFDEDYMEFRSDINRMGRVLALGRKMDDFAIALKKRIAPAGAQWQYTSIDTHIIGMIMRGATGRSIAELMNEKIIKKLGLEVSPYYLTDGVGEAFVLGGLNFITRDYARFGQMMMQDGYFNGQQIVPKDWVAQSTAASAKTLEGEIKYGYQWWVPADAIAGQEFMARGIYGQNIYIDKSAKVVIVSTAADRQFREEGVNDLHIEMFRQIVQSSREKHESR